PSRRPARAPAATAAGPGTRVRYATAPRAAARSAPRPGHAAAAAETSPSCASPPVSPIAPAPPSAHAPRTELDADARPHRLGRLEHRVLPGPLARAAHDDQVAVSQREAELLSSAVRPQRQLARSAHGQDRDHGVGQPSSADAVTVPRDAVPAVAVVAQPGGAERLTEFGKVMRAERLPRLGQDRVG